MQKQRSRLETTYLTHLKKSDIKRLFNCTHTQAVKIYKLADMLDDQELGDARIETSKVRITSVCQAYGFTLEQLRKIIGREERRKET